MFHEWTTPDGCTLRIYGRPGELLLMEENLDGDGHFETVMLYGKDRKAFATLTRTTEGEIVPASEEKIRQHLESKARFDLTVGPIMESVIEKANRIRNEGDESRGNRLQMSSASETNAATGRISQTDIYTRGGETNLIRLQKVLKDGTIQARIHRIYQKGQHVADIAELLGSFSMATDAGSPYHMDIEFWPDKTVRAVGLLSTNGEMSDMFLGTNGVIVPVSSPDLRKAQGIGVDTIELMRNATNTTRSQFYDEVEELMEEHDK